VTEIAKAFDWSIAQMDRVLYHAGSSPATPIVVVNSPRGRVPWHCWVIKTAT